MRACVQKADCLTILSLFNKASVCVSCCNQHRLKKISDRQTISFIEISIEAGILLASGGKHEGVWPLRAGGWQELNPCRPDQIGRDTAFALSQLGQGGGQKNIIVSDCNTVSGNSSIIMWTAGYEKFSRRQAPKADPTVAHTTRAPPPPFYPGGGGVLLRQQEDWERPRRAEGGSP